MKLKEWEKQRFYEKLDPTKTPIFCPDCGEFFGYQEDYMFVVLQYPVACKKCDEIVIYPNIISYTSNTKYSIQ